ncbi:DedA family protein [Micromonospora craniellae]|uniref:DedA family protein n=1 Tax=Micromonospora craniellae TaxID=2294034 RepID=A0A372G3J2_9ACTN|nr:DedA family protein [Micromonospora craniellae]QOC91165.1 DedA family protein [Micromonospora craniellae]RFS47290.1 DedA family protein [Micromonospora craniellae]
MHDLLNSVQSLPPGLIYVVAALVVAAETALIVGLVAPGEATLLLVGFLTYTGTLRLGPALAVMIVAAAAGDAAAFRAGRRYGPRLRAGRWGARVGPQRWARADAMLGRMGGRGVLTARWVAFARTLVPRLAGAAGMPYRRFAPWNLAGVVTWVGGSVLVGHLAGESYETVSRLLGRATGAVLVLIAALLVVVLVGRWLGRNPDPAWTLLTRAVGLPPLRWLSARYGLLFFLLSLRLGPAWALLANLAAGVVLLFVVGLVIAWTLRAVVRHSGLALVDGAIAGWFAARRTPDAVEATQAAVSVLRGSSLIVVVAVVALVQAWRHRPWQADLLSVVGTVGAFVPLVVLAVVADLAAGGRTVLFSTQNVVVTASLCTLAWLLSRGARWPLAVAAWTVAAAGVVAIGGARLYLGVSTASGTVGAVLLGAAWPAVFMVAWATRDRAVTAASGRDAGFGGTV